jgi:nucleoside-diphosphate-sugar epimerase
MNNQDRSFLIAGGAGFIGSHLVIRLLEHKSTKAITVLDNFSTGNRENLSCVLGDPRLEIIECDIIDDLKLAGNKDFDVIMHLAAIANPTDYESNPLPTLLVNSQGSERLLELSKKCSAQYIFFSSSEVYGSYDYIPSRGLREDALSHLTLNQTRTPYPIGKCYGEELTKYRCQSYQIPYNIIRPFNVYGPRMDTKTNYGRVIPNFITWALHKHPLQVQGNGEQIRTFCHIQDFINALEVVIRHKTPPPVMNIGSPIPTPIITLAKLINKMLANDAGIVYTNRYPHETLSRIPDIGVITSLGWRPMIDLEQGITNTIDWMENQIKL